MEILLIFWLISGLSWWCIARLYQWIRRSREATRAQERAEAQTKLAADRRRAVGYGRDQKLQRLNQQMQQALLQLEQAPDFRRAASFAAQAKDVSVDFRQRQFRRFRPRLVQHAVAKLRAGGNAEELKQSLDDLVTALGLASFEADYLWQEAERLLARRATASPNFGVAVSTLEQEHLQRMQVLRDTPGIQDELREQLLEAEEQRFRESLLALNEQPAER